MRRQAVTTLAFGLVAFIAGGAVLIVEIAGARMMSGVIGNSIYTWSALIATVLLSLSLGSLVGGFVADRFHDMKAAIWTMVFAAVSTALVPLVAKVLQEPMTKMGLIEGALVGCACVFVLPSFAYGMIPPMCVRLLTAWTETNRLGVNAGVISMAGSFGSFLGALITPFWLLPKLAMPAIFTSVAAVVLVTPAVLLLVRGTKQGVAPTIALVAGALLIFALPHKGEAVVSPVIFEQQTAYHRIRVEEFPVSGIPSRFLMLDTTMEGGVMSGQETLPLEYQNTWHLVTSLGVNVHRALCIGAGAFGVPTRLAKQFPDAQIDVVEIDPKVIEAGARFFGTSDYANLRVIPADGRVFLRQSHERYDAIFVDAYHGVRYIPPHLTTLEFFQLCHDHLNSDGVLMMNIISAAAGPNAELFRAFGATVQKVFASTKFIPLQPVVLQSPQNIVLVCASKTLPDSARNYAMRDLSGYVPPEVSPIVDDKNPIEAILARQLRQAE